MNETSFIPDWYVEEPDERKAIHNISNIKKVNESVLENASY